MQRKLWPELVRECCLANLGAGTQKHASALHFPTRSLPQADLKASRCLCNENKSHDWLSKSHGIREIQWLVELVTWNKRNSVTVWIREIHRLVPKQHCDQARFQCLACPKSTAVFSTARLKLNVVNQCNLCLAGRTKITVKFWQDFNFFTRLHVNVLLFLFV